MLTYEDREVIREVSLLAEKKKSFVERHLPALQYLTKGKLSEDPVIYPLWGDKGISVVTEEGEDILVTWEELEQYYAKDLKRVQKEVMTLPSPHRQLLSDGHHSFEELYRFWVIYSALLFGIWHTYYSNKYNVSKSFRHYDGQSCSTKQDEWFIVTVVITDRSGTDTSGSTTQISHHYHKKYWDLFNVPSYETSPVPFDGHTSTDALHRLFKLREGEHVLHK